MTSPTPEQRRDEVLDRFRELAAQVLRGRWTSLTLCVAQYWNDEATDAVHGDLVLSERANGWPHRCPEDYGQWGSNNPNPTVCEACGDVPALLPWNSNGWAIEAFAPFCREGASQEDELDEAALPYAIAVRTPSGIEVEVIGEPTRPWLLPPLAPIALDAELEALLELVYLEPESDTPRHVVADWLLEQGDPRGGFIAAQLNGETASTSGYSGAWSGPLAAVTSTPETVFRRGFPTECTVCFLDADAVSRWGESPAWRTIERIRWTAESLLHVPNLLDSVTRIDGFPEAGLEALERAGHLSRITHLELQVESATHLDRLERAVSLEWLSVMGSIDHGYRVLQIELPSVQLEAWVDRSISTAWLDGALRRPPASLALVHTSGLCFTWQPGVSLTIEQRPVGWGNLDRKRAEIETVAEWFSRHAPACSVQFGELDDSLRIHAEERFTGG